MEIPGYEITRCIGQGGMATAYLARQTSLDRLVVLKILDTSTVATPEIVERFLNEGRMIASLRHPNIITIYDINTAGSDVYIAMEFVDGGDLKERLEFQSFAPSEAISIIRSIAAGLAVAHKNGIVHRDVKPGNVLFRSDGTPLLSDFGIAKKLDLDNDLTKTGMFLGSPNYMAPEQADAGVIDGRADIYALGVILYEMLTGQKPYYSESVIDVILMHKKDPIPTLPLGLEQYQELLNLMLAKDRNDRFRDADSLLDYLERLSKRVPNRSLGEMATDPDIDVTGEHEMRAAAAATRVTLARQKQIDRRALLLIVLVIVGLANLVLAFLGRDIKSPDGLPVIAQSALTIPPTLKTAAAPATISDLDKPQAAQVIDAMRWLGQHSLNEYRLTSPPEDNAYYYFSRLLQLKPDDLEAKRGLAEIAARYAVLADQEIANNNNEKASRLISIGLQIDPNNRALRALDQLALPSRNSFVDKIRDLFR